MPIPAVILAAGASRRLGYPKQALLWDGEPLLHRTARVALEAGFAPVSVVVGAAMDASLAALKGLPVQVVANPEWEEGMGASIRAGMAALVPQAPAVLLLVCDQPGVSRALLDEIAERHRQTPDRVVASVYAGIRGVPALFPARRFAELRALCGDRGARSLLQGNDIQEVPFPEGARDVDTPADVLPEQK